MQRLFLLLEEVRLPRCGSPYWLSWPLGSALIKHYSLGGVYLHSSGGGESKIKGSVD